MKIGLVFGLCCCHFIGIGLVSVGIFFSENGTSKKHSLAFGEFLHPGLEIVPTYFFVFIRSSLATQQQIRHFVIEQNHTMKFLCLTGWIGFEFGLDRSYLSTECDKLIFTAVKT